MLLMELEEELKSLRIVKSVGYILIQKVKMQNKNKNQLHLSLARQHFVDFENLNLEDEGEKLVI